MNNRPIIVAALPLLLICTFAAQAQTQWTRISIPANEGQVDLRPEDSLRGFLLTKDAGYRTTNGGISWQPVLQIREGDRHLHINPDGAGILLSGGVLYRTSDHGAGWDSVTVGLDALLTGGVSVEAVAAPGSDRYFFLTGGGLYESDANASALQPLTVPLLDLQSLTVASAETWALTSEEAVAITTDAGATWHTRSTDGTPDVLALSPGGAAMLGFNRTPEQVDPIYTFNGGVSWRGIDWLDEAEQIAWPRIPETAAPSEPFLDVAGCAVDGSSIMYSYPLDDTERGALYQLGPAGTPMRWCGLSLRIDAIYPVSAQYAWALRNRADETQTLSTVWRVYDTREHVPTLRARDASTDLRPAVHVAVSEGRAAAWNTASVQRSGPDSMWVLVDSLQFPLRSVVDTSVAAGGTYRYRADFLHTDDAMSTAYSAAVSAQSGSVLDMRDFLLPPANTDLHYVDSIWREPDHDFIGLGTLSYEYLETRTYPPFEIVPAYRKIYRPLLGDIDTSDAAIVELSSDPPALLVRDNTEKGWSALAQRDSLGGGYFETHSFLDDGSEWLNLRFVSPDVYVDDQQRQRLWTLESFPAANRISTELYAQRGVGIVFGTSSSHVVQDRTTGTLTLQSVTGVTPEAEPGTFSISGTWPQPASSTVHIAVDIEKPQTLRLSLHDMLGREVALLTHGQLDAGHRVFRFDAGALPRGLYFLRAASGEHLRVRKLLLR